MSSAKQNGKTDNQSRGFEELTSVSLSEDAKLARRIWEEELQQQQEETRSTAVTYHGPYEIQLNLKRLTHGNKAKIPRLFARDWASAFIFVYPEDKKFVVSQPVKNRSAIVRKFVLPQADGQTVVLPTLTMPQVQNHSNVVLIEGLTDPDHEFNEARSLMIDFVAHNDKQMFLHHVKSWTIEVLEEFNSTTTSVPIAEKIL